MPPSKWDEEEEDISPPLVISRRKFDDEEEEEVLDSWDAAEDSEAEREKQAKAAAEAKAKADIEAASKKSKAQRIEEYREQRRLKAKAAEETREAEEDSNVDEAERLRQLRATEKDADLKHAEDLFGSADVDRMAKRAAAPKPVVVTDSKNPTSAIDLSIMALFKPTSKDQFNQLTATLIPLLTANSKKPHFSLWAQDFVKQLVKELPSAEVKKAASALTAVANERMKEERAADKGTKKSKAAKTKVTLNMSRDNKIEDSTYDGDDGMDDGDFM